MKIFVVWKKKNPSEWIKILPYMKKIFSSQKMQLTDEIFCVYIQFLNKVKIFIVNSIWIIFFLKISWFAQIFYINPTPPPLTSKASIRTWYGAKSAGHSGLQFVLIVTWRRRRSQLHFKLRWSIIMTWTFSIIYSTVMFPLF